MLKPHDHEQHQRRPSNGETRGRHDCGNEKKKILFSTGTSYSTFLAGAQCFALDLDLFSYLLTYSVLSNTICISSKLERSTKVN